MLKQSSSRTKKVLTILLVALFVASLTGVTASAARHDGGGGHRSGGHHGGGHHGSGWG